MKFIRLPFLKKFIASFLVLLILESTLQASITYALTTGPHQPEYISYEGPGSTDMVNLSTGDFTFSLPILEVPGPEGSFSLPLSYHAGIGVEQEASWVGLGWTLNPGAITRDIVEYPDDASGEQQSIHVQDLNVIRGWTSSILGLGQIGWNNQTGHSGSISILGLLNYNYSDLGTDVLGIAGVNFSSNGVKVDPVGVAMAALTIASYGIGATGAEAKSVLSQVAGDLTKGAVQSAIFGSRTPSVGANGFWSYNKEKKQKLFHKNYWIWLDKTRTEQMVGVLNLGGGSYLEQYGNIPKAPVLSLEVNNNSVSLNKFSKSISTSSSTQFQVGVASDIAYYIDPISEFYDQFNPSGLATDNYNVRGPGISGNIKPYRLDIGSVSVPREMSSFHERLAPVAFQDYKVPFVYEGSNSSAYYYHAGSPSLSSPTTSTLNVNGGIASVLGSSNPNSNTSIRYDLNDYIFGENQRFSSAVSSTKKIPQQNHVEWFSNSEILYGSAMNLGFIDFTGDAQERVNFRSNHGFDAHRFETEDEDITDGVIELKPFETSKFSEISSAKLEITQINYDGQLWAGPHTYSNVPITAVNSNSVTFDVSSINPVDKSSLANKYFRIRIILDNKYAEGIGGYSVTNGNGLTYHYALPVYDKEMLTQIEDVADPNKKTTIERYDAFANTWLLTAITGPDYFDFNQNGFPDEADYGYWVRLNYGKHNPNQLFKWRIPYADSNPDPDNLTKVYSEGIKELYYLNSIQTRSHTALFIKDVRLDGKGYLNPGYGSQLYLSQIYLLKNEDYEYLTDLEGFNLGSDVGITSKVWIINDFNASQLDYLKANVIKKIKFTYSYDLSKGTNNSFSPEKGKLTLKKVSIFGRNDFQSIPDFKFEYGYNPNYNKDYWDAWGYYNNTNSRISQESDLYATAWSLSKVITPMGHEIEISYERDQYATIWGTNLGVTSFNVNNPNWVIDGVPYSGSDFEVGDIVTISGKTVDGCGNPPSLEETTFSHSASITEVGYNYIKLSWYPPGSCTGGSGGTWNVQGTIVGDNISKRGGGLRVASIITDDGNGMQFKNRYLYNNGAVSKEPEYIKSIFYPADPFELPDFPITPVIYGEVTVLQGKLNTDADYHTKSIYQFEVPSSDQIVYTKNIIGTKQDHIYHYVTPPPFASVSEGYLTKSTHEIDYYTSRIGRLNSLQIYGQNGLVSSTDFYYDDNNNVVPQNQGLYTEGTIMADRVNFFAGVSTLTYDMISRTLKREHPNVLLKVETVRDGLTTSSEDLAWDFNTGVTTEKKTTSALGISTKTVIKPAYQFYDEMGPKSSNFSGNTYKNMVNQVGAQYTYKLDNTGAVVGLLGASATTWKNQWSNYRRFSGGVYSDGFEGPNIWRKYRSYTYKGDYADLNEDGTLDFTSGDEFSFLITASNPGWQKIGEVSRYDHYSLSLDTKDINGLYASTKTDLEGRHILASASNAHYNEFAYSGAEDGDNSALYFGGEVARGNGTVIFPATPGEDTHTGKAAVQVTAGNKTFIFKPVLDPAKTYRASVWTNSLDGVIYYNNGGSDVTVAPVSTKKVGNWYQINMQVPGNAFSEIGVKSTNGTVTFDDFRFQPLDAAVTANVYDAHFGNVEYVLDNQNMYTKYEYNDAGILTKTYRETFLYGTILVSESKQNYRRQNIDQ